MSYVSTGHWPLYIRLMLKSLPTKINISESVVTSSRTTNSQRQKEWTWANTTIHQDMNISTSFLNKILKEYTLKVLHD